MNKSLVDLAKQILEDQLENYGNDPFKFVAFIFNKVRGSIFFSHSSLKKNISSLDLICNSYMNKTSM